MCHICLFSPVVLSNSSTPGYKWEEVVGGQEPTTDTEIRNTQLAAALEVTVYFTDEDLDTFEVEVFYDRYIKVNKTYYTLAGACRS